MKLYNAGIYTAGFCIGGTLYERLTENEKYQRLVANEGNLLESYHYVGKQRSVDMIRRDGRQVFLDSGAFSAWSLGAKVDMAAYCEYIKKNDDIIRKDDGAVLASVMDAIGDALGTYQNQLAMEAMGVTPLPCFHFGEDPRYLEYYISKYSYITLGGMVAQSTPALILWLDDIWEKYLTDGSGRPKIKVHGFGLTTPELMRRYPWYSVDSSSWVQIARVGGMLMLPEARVINVSNQSPQRRVENQHITTIPPLLREAVEAKFRAEGVDLDRMQETYLARWTYNQYAFCKLGDIITAEKKGDPRFIRPQPGLF
jgi:hypothetical protein